jgi:hypothetical protein
MIVHVRDSKDSSRSSLASRPALVAPVALLLALALLGALALLSGSRTSSRETEVAGIEVEVGQTVEITSSHRFCWFPTIHRFSTGEIMVTMRMSPDENNPEGDFSAYCISKDAGVTWSQRYSMGSGANMDAARSAEPEEDGKICQLYSFIEPDPPSQSQDFRLTLTKWSRGGLEFQQWRDVSLHFREPILMSTTDTFDRHVPDGHLKESPSASPWGTIVHGSNGDLLAVVECNTAEHPKYGRDVLIYSRDQGKTWQQRSVVAAFEPEDKLWPWAGPEGPNEAALVRLADRRLLTVFRTGGGGPTGRVFGNLGETWSSDDGESWTPPIPCPFRGVAPRIRRLNGGLLALTTGRPDPVAVRFSLDGTGKEWTPAVTIADHKNGRWCTHYSDFVELEPGKLLVVYDEYPQNWPGDPSASIKSKSVVYATIVNVHKK